MRWFFLILTFGNISIDSWSQSGCTDPRASNFNASARVNDGSCIYTSTSLSLTNIVSLPAALAENSGLIFTSGQLWTFNDGGNSASIYRINQSSGAIEQTINILNATNVDWEAITADDQFIFIGDFGNNVNGNRTDLRIYRLSKAGITADATINLTAELIDFNYEDQVIQNPVTNGANNTAFDCEAFFVKNDTLHLFTKDWINEFTRHYMLPITPGTHVAKPHEQFQVDLMVTDASISNLNDDEIVLVGYRKNQVDLAMWVLYDYPGNNFFSGNKRRFSLGKTFDFANSKGQLEGITFSGALNGYVSSEEINQSPIFVPQRLYSFSLESFVDLPVTLTKVNVALRPHHVEISWQTSSESQNHYFAIERSRDGIHFAEIGRVFGKGNSTTPANYVYYDQSPGTGHIYYRLKQVDRDGTETIFKTGAVFVPGAGSGPVLYPNPVTGNIVQLSVSENNGSLTTYQILDVHGGIKKTGSFPGGSGSIDLSGLVPGNYILRTGSGESIRLHKNQ